MASYLVFVNCTGTTATSGVAGGRDRDRASRTPVAARVGPRPVSPGQRRPRGGRWGRRRPDGLTYDLPVPVPRERSANQSAMTADDDPRILGLGPFIADIGELPAQ
jgi:hypothetical protein